MVVAECRKPERMKSYCLLHMDFQFCKMERVLVLEMDGGGGCTTVRMYQISVNCTLKMVRRRIFMLSVSYHNKKWKKINSIDFHI